MSAKPIIETEELVDAYLAANRMHSFEGTDGVRKLDTICDVLGYSRGQFINGRPLENFLADNPGACDAIAEFIREWVPKVSDWQRVLREELGEYDDE